MAKQEKKYSVKPQFIGKTAYVAPPLHERKDGGKFELSNELSQKDLAYLHDVIGFDGVEKSE